LALVLIISDDESTPIKFLLKVEWQHQLVGDAVGPMLDECFIEYSIEHGILPHDQLETATDVNLIRLSEKVQQLMGIAIEAESHAG
jgi:hypothetical protein